MMAPPPRPTDGQRNQLYALHCMGMFLARFMERKAIALDREIARNDR